MPTDFDTLRKKHPRFIYQSFDYQITDNQLEINWHFHLEPDIDFQPTLTIPLLESELDKINQKDVIDNLIFHLGLVEMISYWKVSCAPEIVVEAGQLTKEQMQWWKDLFIQGLGEFFYTNQIDFTQKNFFEISSWYEGLKRASHENLNGRGSDRSSSNNEINNTGSSKKIIIPIGGGKDSAVTAEILKDLNPKPQPWSLNPIPASKSTSQIAGYENLRTAHRTIDQTLLELNEEGYLNGHTPFSAYLSFFYALVGFITGANQIALSNEQSANECNTVYKGYSINHQYSKTFQYEQKFRDYSQKYLIENLEYFSFLRPLHELQIAKLFSNFPEHFSTFRSCNVGQKQGVWCHHCPKCLFAFLMIFPFTKHDQIVGQIFDSNLFEDESLLPIALELTQQDQTKPFECVGSYEESKIAFYLSIQKYNQANKNLPVILREIQNQVLAKEDNLDQRADAMLTEWNEENNLTEDLKNLLKNELKD